MAQLNTIRTIRLCMDFFCFLVTDSGRFDEVSLTLMILRVHTCHDLCVYVMECVLLLLPRSCPPPQPYHHPYHTLHFSIVI